MAIYILCTKELTRHYSLIPRADFATFSWFSKHDLYQKQSHFLPPSSSFKFKRLLFLRITRRAHLCHSLCTCNFLGYILIVQICSFLLHNVPMFDKHVFAAMMHILCLCHNLSVHLSLHTFPISDLASCNQFHQPSSCLLCFVLSLSACFQL